jgi:hypothetical protein
MKQPGKLSILEVIVIRGVGEDKLRCSAWKKLSLGTSCNNESTGD